MGRPSGIVTFLFTDVEGSTRRWEAEPDSMRAALAVHDEVLRSTFEAADGWVFKHTGDGVCAAFISPDSALDAAMSAQRVLELPVRMGMATGEAELRDDDYFGPALNRAARVMAAGHGGQVLVAESTAALVNDGGLLDLGERRLRDLSGAQRLFQATGPGLRLDFPPLRTLDSVPGNLPVQTTSLIGRDLDVAEIAELVREHRLVTLTGVGGVGKTRLALQVAAELVPDFPDGVWLVELAELSDPAAVPSAVAAAVGVTPQAGMSITQSVAESLAGRQMLMVLDNCEHVLDAAGDLVEAVLGRSVVAKVVATSREGLRVRGEFLWAVPSLDTSAGTKSAAVALFVERAEAVAAGFSLTEVEATAVAEICGRLDGIALAIELAAARMVSMSPSDVRDRLGDRFRLLGGGRRGLERHQTLRHAVQWSYELLDDEERTLLNRCSVFAGGFDLAAAVAVGGAGDLDEFAVLDLLDSLVRKSLLAVETSLGPARYTMLETIRQFCEEQLASTSALEATLDRHAGHFAARAEMNFDRWASRDQPAAIAWYDAELANLRSGFTWAVDRGDLDAAATIAVKVAFTAVFSESYEPIAWCEQLLAPAEAQQHRLLRYLYAGSTLCAFSGRPEEALEYGKIGLALAAESHFTEVPHEFERTQVATGYIFTGQPEAYIEEARAMSGSPNDELVLGTCVLLWTLSIIGEFDEAMSLADEMLVRAEATGVPVSIAFALSAYGRAFSQADPEKALSACREGVRVARESGNRLFESVGAMELAGLEARNGDSLTALDSFEQVIDVFHKTGNTANLASTLGYLAVFLDRTGRPSQAAVLHGAATRNPAALAIVADLTTVAKHIREALGDKDCNRLTSDGATMDTAEAVEYAQVEIQRMKDELSAPS
jgi:predicted ATPase